MKTCVRLILGGGLLLLAAAGGRAQTYDLSWFTVAGGGGTSTGGVYSVSGTIGQADAGSTMSGGAYTLTGGFWSGAVSVTTPSSPPLTVTIVGHVVTVSWPSSAVGFTLEQSATLNPSDWQPAPQTVNDNGVTKSITLSAPSGSLFYRLVY
jgi:hypothetical protein